MDDLENIHAARASELIRDFQIRATGILTGSAKAVAAALEALSEAHADFAADLGVLGMNTEAAINNRLETTRQKHEELLHHFMGTTPLKEPVIRIAAPHPAMPKADDGPGLGVAEYTNGGAAAP